VSRPKAQWLAWAMGSAILLFVFTWFWSRDTPVSAWTDEELALLQSLSLDGLPPVPAEPSNAVAEDPRAAEFGRQLFFDTRLSGNGTVACATCHQPQRRFTDGLPRGRGLGHSRRNTHSIVGSALSPWLYWDGRKDSLWAQALSPLEDPEEHGANRMALARLVSADVDYRDAYQALFGDPPDFSDGQRFPLAAAPGGDAALAEAWGAMDPADQDAVTRVFVNLGKSIAAYERLILPTASRFDAYVRAAVKGEAATQAQVFSESEERGLRLFIGKANCLQCHNGPLLTNNEFHNTGQLSLPGEVPDQGRADGVRLVRQDEFNCLGKWSDDPERRCEELRYARHDVPELIGAMRTPSLRNLADTEPYMHQGQLANLADVLAHYASAPGAMVGHNDTQPLMLGQRDLRDIEAFLHTLAAPETQEGMQDNQVSYE